MGDGIQRNYAIIINGDTEERHLDNVSSAITALLAEDPSIQLYVANPARPQIQSQNLHYFEASQNGLNALLQGLPKPDDDDHVLVSLTGHGGEEAGISTLGLDKEKSIPITVIVDQLKSLQYGKAVVIADECLGGQAIRLFGDTRTAVFTLGSGNEITNCHNFMPHFWNSDKTALDADHDTIITLEERIAYAHRESKGLLISLEQYYSPFGPISLTGAPDQKPDFPTEVVEVNSPEALEQTLGRLGPAQLALVEFSAQTCGPCRTFKVSYDALGQSLGGHYLVIRAQLKDSDDMSKDFEAWRPYGLNAFPTVAWVSRKNGVNKIARLDDYSQDPRETLLAASLNSSEDRFAYHMNQLKSLDEAVRIHALVGLSQIEDKYAEVFPILLKEVAGPGMEHGALSSRRHHAVEIECFAERIDPEKALPILLFLLADPGQEEDVRAGAAHILALYRGYTETHVNEIARGLKDPSEKVQKETLQALGATGNQALTVLSSIIPFLSHPRLCLNALDVLGNIADPSMRNFEGLKDHIIFLATRHTDLETRLAAIGILGLLYQGEREKAPLEVSLALEQVPTDSSGTVSKFEKEVVLMVIGAIRNPSQLPLLVASLSAPEAELRLRALIGLKYYYEEGVSSSQMSVLLTLLSDPDLKVRVAALLTYGTRNGQASLQIGCNPNGVVTLTIDHKTETITWDQLHTLADSPDSTTHNLVQAIHDVIEAQDEQDPLMHLLHLRFHVDFGY